MRWEDSYNDACALFNEGTPPHAWGRSSASISAGSVIGYTPTRVGKIGEKYAE